MSRQISAVFYAHYPEDGSFAVIRGWLDFLFTHLDASKLVVVDLYECGASIRGTDETHGIGIAGLVRSSFLAEAEQKIVSDDCEKVFTERDLLQQKIHAHWPPERLAAKRRVDASIVLGQPSNPADIEILRRHWTEQADLERQRNAMDCEIADIYVLTRRVVRRMAFESGQRLNLGDKHYADVYYRFSGNLYGCNWGSVNTAEVD